MKFSKKLPEIVLKMGWNFPVKTEWNFFKNCRRFSYQFSAVLFKIDRNAKFSQELCEILLKSEWNSPQNCEIF